MAGEGQHASHAHEPTLPNYDVPRRSRHPHRHARVHSLPSLSRSPPSPPSYSEVSEEKTSLDITQKLEKKLAQLNKSENVFARWLFEIVTWLISALCMAAIIVILIKIDNRTLSGRNAAVTAYSVLSKLASGALLLPVSEALGQLKWNWFNGKKSKEVWDFEIFDKASRGAWGSVLLLFRTKGRSLAALGALLTLLLIANDTFFQRVVNLPEEWSQKGRGGIGVSVRYQPTIALETKAGNIQAQSDTNLWPLNHYLLGNGTRQMAFGSTVRADVPVSCSNSNCTFTGINTLGVCSRCADISEILEFGCKTTYFDWIKNLSKPWDAPAPIGSMCGYFLNATDQYPIMVSGYSTENLITENGTVSSGEASLLRILPVVSQVKKVPHWGGSLNFKDIRYPITDLLVIAAKDGIAGVLRNDTPIAQECVLYWCVKTITASYQSGNYSEKITGTFTNTTRGPYPWISTLSNRGLPDLTYLENITITPPGDEKTYGMHNQTHFRVTQIFEDLLPVMASATKQSEQLEFRYKTFLTGGPTLRKFAHNPWTSASNVSRNFDRIATFMTNVLRSDSIDMVEGPAFTIETYIHVEWPWLTFPFTLLLLTLIFLGATVLKTSKSDNTGPGIWKTSAMPTLIYGLPDDMQKQLNTTSIGTGTSMDGAKKLKIRLHPQKGWRVSDQPVSPDSPIVIVRTNQAPPGWI
ncbi:hypothetical protein DM02DRAFT_563204 [Periconia macrospinosa]|uniref:DUF3176 domain-containing protein n=1 Tax=Periconia macrospinosa TaxID=97972 RepID=A0A2V1DST1_9PLEO|nr:hypothetical protein DM02DRAFT_563204 [Periconia macrospinosa]